MGQQGHRLSPGVNVILPGGRHRGGETRSRTRVGISWANRAFLAFSAAAAVIIGTWQRPSAVNRLQSTHVRAVLQAHEILGARPALSNEISGRQRTLRTVPGKQRGGVGAGAVHVTRPTTQESCS